MTENYAGHETPEQRTAMEEAFSRMTRMQASAGPVAERIAETIRNRQKNRQTTTDSED